jgi:hypothetical protein
MMFSLFWDESKASVVAVIAILLSPGQTVVP